MQSAERTGEKPQGGGRYRPRLPGLQGRPRRQRAEAAAVRDRACSAVGALAQNVRPPSALEGRRSNVLTQVPSSCHLSTPQTRTSALTHLHAFLPSPPSRNRPTPPSPLHPPLLSRGCCSPGFPGAPTTPCSTSPQLLWSRPRCEGRMSLPCSVYTQPPRSKASLVRSPLRSSPMCQHLHLDVTFHPTWPNPNFSSSSPTPHQSSSLSRNAYYSPSCWRQNPPTRHVIGSDTRPSCPVCNFQGHFFLGNTATPQPLFTLCIL